MAGRVRARCRVVWALGAGVVVRAAPVELEAPAASARKLRKPCALHVDVHLTGLCTVARCVVCARSGRAVQRVPRRVVLLAGVSIERVGRAQEGVQEGAKEDEEEGSQREERRGS